ncbi:5-formyltetrahydrofolate cyclo-ligase [Malassezia caprae]|uniref:5-formyltetrahydrofolate cyclo-ligase n=1 Tax=Malassezia caprae TaxID=1381934 RepID=A0AAF0IVR3_9BASI|nr:5-formyltetrahydrofolate cyclo-ligase [Malassezia caprae]
MAAVRGAKATLRRDVRQALAALPRAEIDAQSSAVTERVLSHSHFQRAATVSIYLSAPSAEIDTWALCRAALHSGKRLYVPRFSTLASGADARETHSFTEMLMLRVYDTHELDHALTVNKWAIAEPALARADGTPRENALDAPGGLDLIVLPGLAFDRQGWRLGQGKGYYDRHLAHYATPYPATATTSLCTA